jgi:hypothetical protein
MTYAGGAQQRARVRARAPSVVVLLVVGVGQRLLDQRAVLAQTRPVNQ